MFIFFIETENTDHTHTPWGPFTATDRDAGDNAAIVYSIENNETGAAGDYYFHVCNFNYCRVFYIFTLYYSLIIDCSFEYLFYFKYKTLHVYRLASLRS